MELDINIVISKLLWNNKIKDYTDKDQSSYKKIQKLWNGLSTECQFDIVGDVGMYLSKCRKTREK
jgi:hypothetical protein